MNLAQLTATGIGKIAIAFLGTSVIALIGIAGHGALRGELRGSVAFGLLVAAVLVVPALVLANWAPEIRAVGKVAWLVNGAIGLGLVLFAVPGAKDLDIVVATLVAVLAFPVGIVVAVAGSALFAATSPIVASVVLWAVAMVLGYCQWFVLWPKFTRGREMAKT